MKATLQQRHRQSEDRAHPTDGTLSRGPEPVSLPEAQS